MCLCSSVTKPAYGFCSEAVFRMSVYQMLVKFTVCWYVPHMGRTCLLPGAVSTWTEVVKTTSVGIGTDVMFTFTRRVFFFSWSIATFHATLLALTVDMHFCHLQWAEMFNFHLCLNIFLIYIIFKQTLEQ